MGRGSAVNRAVRARLGKYLGLLVLALGIAVFPTLGVPNYLQGIAVLIGIYALAAIGLDLLLGYAGQLSLAHAAFFGLGGYVSGILTRQYHIPPLLVVGLVLCAALAIALVVGIPLLRLQEHYLALATLGLVLIAENLAVALRAWTGGLSGLPGIPPFSVGDLVFNSNMQYFILVWSLVLIFAFLALNMAGSQVGRAWRAIHADELAASAMGIDVFRRKLQAFLISAAAASLAGSLYAHYLAIFTPKNVGLLMSIDLVLMLVLGGLGTVYGAILGAAVLKLLPEIFEFLKDYHLLVDSMVLILLVINVPDGIAGGMRRLVMRLRSARPRPAAPSNEVENLEPTGNRRPV